MTSDIVERFEEIKREMITETLLKDVLDGIEHFYGKDGIEQVANFALMANRARESNRVMDELDRLYGPFSSKEL
jgi:hypothetical protein